MSTASLPYLPSGWLMSSSILFYLFHCNNTSLFAACLYTLASLLLTHPPFSLNFEASTLFMLLDRPGIGMGAPLSTMLMAFAIVTQMGGGENFIKIGANEQILCIKQWHTIAATEKQKSSRSN
ncbi:hypothetical protein ERO13_A08G153900v2 [Gossypium hirsutum]|nr:hypothetical protein ERO13_A08G153900v2 [Gossypium hirsutum]